MSEVPAPPPLPTTEPPPRKSRKGLWIGLAVAAFAVIVALAIIIPVTLIGQAQAAEEARIAAEEKAAAAAEAARLDEIRAALDDCGIQIGGTTTLLDGGEAVEIGRVSKYDGPDIDELYCSLDALGAPQSIEAKIGQTRALDGRQSAEWGDFEASWTYHPDDGATVLIERTD